MLCVARCAFPLFVICCSLSGVCSFVFVCYVGVLFVVRWLWLVVYCFVVVFVVRCSSFVVCWWLMVVACLLFAVCWLFVAR